MIYQPTDIHWVKNVKRDEGEWWAFFEDGTETMFDLTFSKNQRNSAREIECGEVILLFQRVDKIPNVPINTYLTHLVTPIGPLIEQPDSIERFRWYRKVVVIARANPKFAVTAPPTELNFQRVNFGRVAEIALLNPVKGKHHIQQLLWKLFREYFNESLDDDIQSNAFFGSIDEIPAMIEGAEFEVTRTHIIRERNRLLVDLVKSRAMRTGNGTILCECCGFDFVAAYGELGRGYIEGHHRQFISVGGERETKPEDIALVCANCHRMLHRIGPNRKHYSVENLGALIKSINRNNKTNE